MKRLILTLIFFPLFLQLQGCAGGVIIAAASTAVVVGNDERTLAEQLNDNALSFAAKEEIKKLNLNKEKVRIKIFSNSRYILLTGQVTDQQLKTIIEQQLKTLKQAKGVYNQLRIAPLISFSQQSKDIWITTKVKSRLAADEAVNPFKIKVVTENGEVFLIGKVDQQTAKIATHIASRIDGVKRVNRVFYLIN